MKELSPVMRQFVLLPFMHSELLQDQQVGLGAASGFRAGHCPAGKPASVFKAGTHCLGG